MAGYLRMNSFVEKWNIFDQAKNICKAKTKNFWLFLEVKSEKMIRMLLGEGNKCKQITNILCMASWLNKTKSFRSSFEHLLKIATINHGLKILISERFSAHS